jgi:hypothetical protein
MATNVQSETPPNMTGLMAGIITDAQKLIRQEVNLARSELYEEWNKLKTASMALAVGAGVAFVGVLLLTFMVVYLLNWADPAHIPLWIGFLIVGGVLAALGGALLYRGISKAGEIQVPPPQTTDALKEII